MNITGFSINRNRITFVVLGTIMIMGMVFYQSLSRDSMPPYTVRVATVVSSFPGSSPERVEQLVTDKVEKIAQELPELKKVTSTSRSGLSVVSVELKDQVKPEDLQAVWDRLRRKLSQIQGLPSGVKPNLNDDGIGEVFGIAVGLVLDGFSYAEAKNYIDDIKDDLIPASHQLAAEGNDYYTAYEDTCPLTESHPFNWNELFYYLSLAGLQRTETYGVEINDDPINNYLNQVYLETARSFSKECNE